MISKLAVKQLTASDLTLFSWHFKNRNAGNQKAINLNADVFVGELYPSLPQVASPFDHRIPIDLYLHGPGTAGEVNLQRKIVKGNAYKNWRLNGEFIHNPQDDPTRFNCLESGDLALMEFQGDLSPTTLRIFFVSQAKDRELWEKMTQLVDRISMVSVDQARLRAIVQSTNSTPAHPIHEFLLEGALEDAARGGPSGIRRLRAIIRSRRVSKNELQTVLRRIDAIGLAGEELMRGHLARQKDVGMIRQIDWTSDADAVSPFDFRITDSSGSTTLLDVKSTSGEFERPIHISLAELETMKASRERYDLYRVYELREREAKLRIAVDNREFARVVLSSLDKLPVGVEVDGFSIDPTVLEFGAEIRLDRQDVPSDQD